MNEIVPVTAFNWGLRHIAITIFPDLVFIGKN
jgi:hypothetical protein